jgi:hypothetical protein
MTFGMQARSHAESVGLKLVGYYQASERINDTVLAPVGEKIAGRIKEGFKDAVALVVSSHKGAMAPFTNDRLG